MKLKYFIYLFTICFISSCAFKPLYKRSNIFDGKQIKIVVKTKESFDNNTSMMKLYLDKGLNKKGYKNSNLKLVVVLDKNISSLGINKDLSSDARMLIMSANFVLYDKKGKLTSGNLSNSSSFNYTTNNYANILSMEDASDKLIKSLSKDLSDLILASSFKRKISP